MGRKRSWGRKLDGILVLNKPIGMSSNEALQQAKRLFFAAKAGHTGNLDPLATGVLPLCFGEATKFSQFLLDSDKGYRTTVTFGRKTASGDEDGEILEDTGAASLTENQVAGVLDKFRGDIEQVPPMYSALKKDGQPLYKLARQGIEVEREARPVSIYRLELTAFRPGPYPEADLEIECSKGTYIRTLAEDIGAALGFGAYVSSLHRFASGPYTESEALELDALQDERGEGRAEQLDHHVLPVESALENMVPIELDANTGFYFKQGQPVMVPKLYQFAEEHAIVRVSLDTGEFLGVAEVIDDGQIAPRRLIAQ